MPALGPRYLWSVSALDHVSLTIDRIGYGASGPGPARAFAWADKRSSRIVRGLRSRAYASAMHPRFARIAGVPGHSLGGANTKIDSSGAHAVRPIAVLSYADVAPTLGVVQE